jgi:tRNA (cmo5U34)-methyltransferase
MQVRKKPFAAEDSRDGSLPLDLIGLFRENGTMPDPVDCNLWSSSEHALEYLRRADSIPHRTEGEAVLLEFIPPDVARILDLGSGDGRLLSLAKADRPRTEFVALDFSPAMLEALHRRFDGDGKVAIVGHDFLNALPPLGHFDSVISSFAIHHVPHERKRSVYQEVFDLLRPGGVFCNLEHVASPTGRLHQQFLQRLGVPPEQEDPSNKLLDLETQLSWLREIGFVDVDCHWKWRELALLAGVKPGELAMADWS